MSVFQTERREFDPLRPLQMITDSEACKLVFEMIARGVLANKESSKAYQFQEIKKWTHREYITYIRIIKESYPLVK